MELTAERRAAASNGRLLAWAIFVGVLIALSFAARYAAEEETGGTRDAVYEWSLAVAGAVQFGIMLALTLWIASGPERRELLGLRAPRSWGAAAGLVLAGLVAVYVVALALEPVFHAGEEQGLTPEGWDPDRADAFVANVVVIAVFAPVVEEFLFRGVGFALLRRFGRAAAVLVTGAAFGLAHGLLGGFVVLTAFGIVLGWLRSRTASVLPCIVLHALFNGLALLAAVLTGGDA
jgi:membrane protease YdiL (CAAX protease family)